MKLFTKQKTVQQLPKKVRLFPLPEVMLLPQTQLPLNIFEKKYIALIDEALAGDRLIAMIQPRDDDNEQKLHKVGCIGRITSYQEASKGQYLITLYGLCRFELVEEILPNVEDGENLANHPPFRVATVNYSKFKNDFEKPSDEQQKLIDRSTLINSIKDMLAQMNLDIEWTDLEETPNEMLVNAISMTSPFNIAEKQALLEAQTTAERAELLVMLSKMTLADAPETFDIIQ